MFINSECREYGIGKLLINDFKKYCVSNNIKDLIVTASAKNINAIEFYKKNGFKDFNITMTMNIEK